MGEMKSCHFKGCTASESQLRLCPCIGGVVYSCKVHLFVLKKVLGNKLLLDERLIKHFYQQSQSWGDCMGDRSSVEKNKV